MHQIFSLVWKTKRKKPKTKGKKNSKQQFEQWWSWPLYYLSSTSAPTQPCGPATVPGSSWGSSHEQWGPSGHVRHPACWGTAGHQPWPCPASLRWTQHTWATIVRRRVSTFCCLYFCAHFVFVSGKWLAFCTLVCVGVGGGGGGGSACVFVCVCYVYFIWLEVLAFPDVICPDECLYECAVFCVKWGLAFCCVISAEVPTLPFWVEDLPLYVISPVLAFDRKISRWRKLKIFRSFYPFPNCPAIAFFIENSTERDRKRAWVKRCCNIYF